MADKTMPTPGPWKTFNNAMGMGVTADRADVAHCNGYDSYRDKKEEIANAHLIAAAGTAAHKVAQMGYDPVEVMRALPTIIRDLADDTDYGWVRDWIARAAGKEDDDGR